MEIHNPPQLNSPKDANDRDFIIYQQGFNSGKEHSHSSPETISSLKKMGDDINNLKIAAAESKITLSNIEKLLTNHINEEVEYRSKQDAFHKEIYDTKADKKQVEAVENNLARVMWIVLGSVITAVVSLVVIKF